MKPIKPIFLLGLLLAGIVIVKAAVGVTGGGGVVISPGGGSSGGATITNTATKISTNLLVTAAESAAIGGTNLVEFVNQDTNKVFQVGTNGVAKFYTNIIASGSVIQTVWVQKTDILTNNVSATWTNILSGTLTPKVLGSRIVVSANVSSDTTSGWVCFLRVATNGAAILAGDSDGANRVECDISYNGSGAGAIIKSQAWLASHVPQHLNSTTYTVQGMVESGGVIYINRSPTDADSASYPRAISTMMIQEIAP